ncbi:uncharacterized protein TRAVEDRAFT_43970 [Trametes versicolor FP-101664 SS1]|uniref:uncharacterized protein n=1 Tax=Trametes versicolor (strain FP-101664) TaxID=717944 RepID=UPI0004622E5E|nr:uncharacterized protein TRAVEDRAFT_43970 [Trametes versicolor FP-101664 SS1]EIW61143.1 hypothetical protein TRAVEDRAFT_43970 [Trametes versicolor FP-101664 SS1]
MSVRVEVDDQDPRVLYSDGWGHQSDAPSAYDDTLSTANREGMTLTLKFSGTLVAVVGCGGDVAAYGYPSVSFLIDGQNYGTRVDTPSLTGSYYNITFFVSPTLPDGEHTLVITNLNGTQPNTFWLDWFWYTSSAVSNSTSGKASAAAPSTTTSGSISTSLLSNTALLSQLPAPPATNTPVSANLTGNHQNLGAIIGGSIGGVAALLLAILGVWFLKRRSARSTWGPQATASRHVPPEEALFVGHTPQFTLPVPSTPSGPSPSFLTNGSFISSPATALAPSPDSSPPQERNNRLSPLLPDSHTSDTADASADTPSAFVDKSNPARTDSAAISGPERTVRNSVRSWGGELDEAAPPPYEPS